MTIHLITGSDPRLVSEKVSQVTRDLINSMDTDENRSTILETHDASSATGQERLAAISQAINSAETMSLFGQQRVVIIQEASSATLAELSPLFTYLQNPIDSTHLVVTASGKLPKSITDALKRAGATTYATTPPVRAQELNVWFLEKFAESGLTIDVTALNEIIHWLGEDQARLPSLIDVLVSAYGTARKLTTDEVVPFLGEAGSVKPWDLTDAIDLGNTARALDMLRRMLRGGGYYPLQVMSVLQTHYTKLMRLDGPDCHSPADALKLIGGNSEFQGRKYLTQYHHLGKDLIFQAVQLLARADINLRGGKDLPEELTMEILVARLCRMGSTGRSNKSAQPRKTTFSPKQR